MIIPVKDDERILETVASVLDAGQHGLVVEVVVADNGSAPDFTHTLNRLSDPRVLVIAATGTVYAVRNRAVEASCGEILFFTDADCVVGPAWMEQGVRALERGCDLAQGFSDSTGHGRAERLIQDRYEAHFVRIPPGAPTECDTRNLAVRRRVFDHVQFNETFRRVGDTEFGLRAEAQGFRVGFARAMRVRHAHDQTLDLFAAKQVCHGWGAQRLMRDNPGLPWHGGQLRLTARVGPRIQRLPGHWLAGKLLAFAAIQLARGIDRATKLPFSVTKLLLGPVDKLAGAAGHLIYRPGAPEPSPSELLRRPLPRD